MREACGKLCPPSRLSLRARNTVRRFFVSDSPSCACNCSISTPPETLLSARTAEANVSFVFSWRRVRLAVARQFMYSSAIEEMYHAPGCLFNCFWYSRTNALHFDEAHNNTRWLPLRFETVIALQWYSAWSSTARTAAGALSSVIEVVHGRVRLLLDRKLSKK